MKEIIALVVLAIIGLFVHQQGKKVGAREAQVENLEEKEDLLNEVANKELEVKQSLPIVDRLRELRERIRGRRGGGS